MSKGISLGNRVKDKITDFEGIAIARVEYLNGTVEYNILPKIDHHGKYPESRYIDKNRLIDLGKEKEINCIGYIKS